MSISTTKSKNNTLALALDVEGDKRARRSRRIEKIPCSCKQDAWKLRNKQ
jgi:hypothetical protein